MNRLWVKLTFSFLAVALLAVGVVAVLAARTTGAEFRQYVVSSGMMAQTGLAEGLTAYYGEHGSWKGVESLLAQLNPGMGFGPAMGMGRGAQGIGGPNLAIADSNGRVVASKTGEAVGEQLSPALLAQGLPLITSGQQVGTLLNLRPANAVLDAQAQAFLGQVRSSLIWAGLLAVALALILGTVVSQRLTAPLMRLTRAASAVAGGDLTQEVPGHGGEEIGQLGAAFNTMTRSLAQAETLRRNLVADVAHELRTPLTVIQGNLQAILDGVYPLDIEQVASLYDETRLLTRLVDDLRDLALADAGQLRLEHLPVSTSTLAQAAVTNFSPAATDAGIALSLELAEDVPEVMGDSDRLAQVLRNLLANALRHTPAGGKMTVRVGAANASVIISVADTGSGIAPEDLPHVFDRFYRGDKSRSRRGGGAGLGLAIARQLVVAHGGAISVESHLGQGTVFTIQLPVTTGSVLPPGAGVDSSKAKQA